MLSHKIIFDFLVRLREKNKAEETVRKHHVILGLLAKVVGRCDIENIDQKEVLLFLGEEGKSRGTILNRFGVLKNFFNWLCSTEQRLDNPMEKINRPKGEKYLPSKIMTEGEVNRVVKVYADQPGYTLKSGLSFRNRVILELMYSCSLRRGEVSSLNLCDFRFKDESIRIKPGKTRFERLVPVGPSVSVLLNRYVTEVRGDSECDALFLSNRGKQLGPPMISLVAKIAIRKAGIRTKATSHSFRKSSATNMLRNKAPLNAVQAILGHQKVSTTEVYTKIYPSDLIRVMKGCHPRERQKNLKLEPLRIPHFLYQNKGFFPEV